MNTAVPRKGSELLSAQPELSTSVASRRISAGRGITWHCIAWHRDSKSRARTQHVVLIQNVDIHFHAAELRSSYGHAWGWAGDLFSVSLQHIHATVPGSRLLARTEQSPLKRGSWCTAKKNIYIYREREKERINPRGEQFDEALQEVKNTSGESFSFGPCHPFGNFLPASTRLLKKIRSSVSEPVVADRDNTSLFVYEV